MRDFVRFSLERDARSLPFLDMVRAGPGRPPAGSTPDPALAVESPPMTTPSVMPDSATETGRAVLARLDSEVVAWLTTITADGRLQSSAVWFLWAAGEFLVFSRAGAPRARNVAANGHVSIHLNSDDQGDGIVTFEGEARLEPGAPPASAQSGVRRQVRRQDQGLRLDAQIVLARLSRPDPHPADPPAARLD